VQATSGSSTLSRLWKVVSIDNTLRSDCVCGLGSSRAVLDGELAAIVRVCLRQQQFATSCIRLLFLNVSVVVAMGFCPIEVVSISSFHSGFTIDAQLAFPLSSFFLVLLVMKTLYFR
jgi:hypothetical protein